MKWIIATFLLFLVVVVLMLPQYSEIIRRREINSCQAQLRKIASACEQYASEHGGEFPASFALLVPDYAKDAHVFICPSSNGAVRETGEIDSWSSYRIIFQGSSIDRRDIMTLVEKSGAHHRGGVNCAFGDVHVEFRSGSLSCANNLKMLGICLKMYKGEHNDAMPTSLDQLYPEYLSGLEALVCPHSFDKIGNPAEINSWSSYELVHGVAMADLGRDVVISEKNGHNHAELGRYKLRNDGSVAFEAN